MTNDALFNGEEFEVKKFVGSIMRNASSWVSYFSFGPLVHEMLLKDLFSSGSHLVKQYFVVKKQLFWEVVFFLVCGVTSRSLAMVMSRQSLRAIPEKNTWEGKTAGNIFFYGWLVLKVFKLYGSNFFVAFLGINQFHRVGLR